MKFTNISLAALALISNSSALNIKNQVGLGADAKATVDHMTEAGRFINGKGEAIILGQTKGHARIELKQIKKYKKDHQLL
jgi:hypothetical protein